MLQESLMEGKQQLDFHRPLLSIRRPENATRSRDSAPGMFDPPVHKSETRSGPVRNPGTIPFHWEHKPGKPKGESGSGMKQHFAPKLPPGRTLNPQDQEPGRKAETKVSVHMKRGNVSAYESPVAEGTKSYDEDARSESFFLNCSASGVNGSDGPETKPSGIFSSDPQTRDLLMGQAKAMASETPQHLSGNPPLPPKEQPRQMKKVIPVRMQAQRAVSVRSLRRIFPNSTHYHENDYKHVNGARQEQRSTQTCQKTDMQEDKVKSSTQPNQSACETQKQNGSVLQGSPKAEGKEKPENFQTSTNDSRSKTSKNFGELLASDDNTLELCLEKTLYVDTVHTAKPPDTDAKVQVKSKCHSPVQELSECRSLKVNAHQNARSETEVPSKKCMQEPDETGEDKNDLKSSNGRQHLLPLPLLKAPSDSWLKRTLPTMSSKNSLGSETFTKIRARPKWETMVKTSNTGQGLKEKLNSIPEA
ncbi:PREDICTED: uncharacterized protein LOC104800840 isoform X2 [Tarenaya hassleriana]|uniref:uncharacterized protein LOC104800840 isoform X2 n=1 Tax=Tarenaya hassleriana TaxID=28532 RepID=UPI00053CA077|nr:PREDICTED: uncharacterized protein LOC104800840 isoform X2 [Tarenaya hassleriana]